MDRINLVAQHCIGAGVEKKLLVANRGEIACRIFRACKVLGLRTVAVYSKEDADSNHRLEADEAFLIDGPDPVAPYLNIEEILKICQTNNVNYVHPGYGFLSENGEFCRGLQKLGVTFVGPPPEVLDTFGDKTNSKAFAIKNNVKVAQGSGILKDAQHAMSFIKENKLEFPILLKAANGGGGRGQRVIRKMEEIEEGFKRCSQEALMSFGKPELFLEEYIENARHIEVQVMCDKHGNYCHIFERDCSLQLRNQKVLEIAPARGICPELRKELTEAALRLCRGCKYENAGTVEFLVKGKLSDPKSRYVFLEVNPRIQVEHTITEEITGTELIQTQIRVAGGESLKTILKDDIKLIGGDKGCAAQLRINLVPGKKTDKQFSKYKPPPGCRVDSGIRQGGPIVQGYDSMIAKLIVTAPDFEQLRKKCIEAIDNFEIEGATVNKQQLFDILNHETFIKDEVYTTFLSTMKPTTTSGGSDGPNKPKPKKGPANVKKERILAHIPGQITEIPVKEGDTFEKDATVCVLSAMKMLNDVNAAHGGKVLKILVKKDQNVNADETIMEVEYQVYEDSASEQQADQSTFESGGAFATATSSPSSGWSLPFPYGVFGSMRDGEGSGFVLRPGQLSSDTFVLPTSIRTGSDAFKKRYKVNIERANLLKERLEVVKQGGGKKNIDKNRAKGKFLARERIAKTLDKDHPEFLELMPLAAWDLYDGKAHSASVVTGLGIVHGRICMFIANDSTINGGAFYPETLKKFTRAQDIANKNHIPCIYFVDGGGANLNASKSGEKSGAPPSVSFVMGGYLFKNQAIMSGKRIPQIGVAFGTCTAGAAYTCAMCDELIMVKDNGAIFLGGPPLVQAATGEVCKEQELGGAAMHNSKSGVADFFADNEEIALRKVRSIVEALGATDNQSLGKNLPFAMRYEEPKYNADELLGVIPEDNKIPFDVREVIARVVDGSRFNEFKPKYGTTIVCGMARICGYTVGIVGNNGMLFSEAAIKATHFIQMCGSRGVPLLFLQNITGFIIGKNYEQLGITKDGAKMVTAVSCVPVPKICLVLAGSHGAGNYAMCGPAFDPRFLFLWPNARISVMGGEQAAKVIVTVKNQQLKRSGQDELPKEFVEQMKQPIIDAIDGTSTAYHSTAEVFDDGIIDPRDTRKTLAMALSACRVEEDRERFGVFRQ